MNSTPEHIVSWSADDLAALAAGHSLHLTAGAAGRDRVEIGMVVVDGDLYVRSFRGPSSAWYRAAVDAGVGRITFDDRAHDVTLAAPLDDIAGIEAAYAAKYGAAAGLVSSPQARAATLRIMPCRARATHAAARREAAARRSSQVTGAAGPRCRRSSTRP